MSIAIEQGLIRFKGHCGADDVEPLLTALVRDRQLKVDLTEADYLNAAIFQVLQAFRPVVLGSSRDTFVRTWLIPMLQSGQSHQAGSAPQAERL
jgi:hypothetical protein